MRSLLLTFALLIPALASADGLPSSPYIQVSGHGELQVAPDVAYVSLSVEKTSADAKAAREDVEARAAKVIAVARGLKIADKDIDAPSVMVYPDYVWVTENPTMGSSSGSRRVRKLVGHHVTRNITLTLRDLSHYGELVDGLFDTGITDLGNVVMDRSDRQALEQKARGMAVADAHDRAAGLAQSAGVSLGSVYSITEQGGGYVPRPMSMVRASSMDAAPATPEYLDGKIEISADVTVFYLINK
ncbi:MAG TPA: SIMPL domain-containing protein [Gammaproteobacteria bacterium]|nr:SIMPL domain-containing protein [Gammaproteobacteria bacterium]